MESRIRVLFLILLALTMSGCAITRNLFGSEQQSAPVPAEDPGQVIEPQVERRDIREADIDTENFEIGAFVGIMSVEDFESNTVYGARLAYHVTESFFVEGTFGQTDAGFTSFERLSGGAPLLSDSDRTYSYYNLSLGYNIFPGEAFLGESRAYNNALYVTAGVGSTRFAADDRFTVSIGAGYRLLLTDMIALHFDVRDHLFDTDLLGEEKTVHNLEGHLGLTVFF
ncbi:MAG: outer membrane beta-barrel domain-containing protein [Woeseia sp.]|nr:outer membrane beta-barrel domain-containing protein [Woeseia sp.]NNL55961.1 outer membrane beta-barrel domain-containing protein [Woeseia sp.]